MLRCIGFVGVGLATVVVVAVAVAFVLAVAVAVGVIAIVTAMVVWCVRWLGLGWLVALFVAGPGCPSLRPFLCLVGPHYTTNSTRPGEDREPDRLR